MPTQYPEVLIQAIASAVIALLMIGFVITIFQLYQRKKLVQEQEMQSLRTTFEKELLQTRLEIQEDVLKKISMEIHDNIGQMMLLTNVNISMLQTLPMPEGAPELIRETKLMLGKATDDLSQLSRSLNSDRITELGVFAAIRQELRLLSQKKLFETFFENETAGTGETLPKETQLLVFRMFQEITNNIIKHAKASEVRVTVQEQEQGIELSVKDNGVGFNFSVSEEKKSEYNGVGLRSLQSRVNLFKGQLHIHSVLQEGTSISIFIPSATAGFPML